MKRVLVIDDDDSIRLIANRALTKLAGWDVREADGGAAGLEAAREGGPLDVILLDVMMPGMDGPTTLAALQADPVTAPVPVVLLTAKAGTAERHALADLGAAGVITKPFDPLVLHEQIAGLLGWPVA